MKTPLTFLFSCFIISFCFGQTIAVKDVHSRVSYEVSADFMGSRNIKRLSNSTNLSDSLATCVDLVYKHSDMLDYTEYQYPLSNKYIIRFKDQVAVEIWMPNENNPLHGTASIICFDKQAYSKRVSVVDARIFKYKNHSQLLANILVFMSDAYKHLHLRNKKSWNYQRYKTY